MLAEPDPSRVVSLGPAQVDSKRPFRARGLVWGDGCQGCRDGHLLVRLAGDISSSRPDFPADAARSDRQGRPKAVAQNGCQGCRDGHLLVRLAGDISSSRPDFPADAARSDRQGRPKAVAQRLALDGCEHGVKLPQSGDTDVSRPFGTVSTTATLPRGVRQWARASRVTNLYSVDHEGRTMMQSCASAARLRGAGPF